MMKNRNDIFSILFYLYTFDETIDVLFNKNNLLVLMAKRNAYRPSNDSVMVTRFILFAVEIICLDYTDCLPTPTMSETPLTHFCLHLHVSWSRRQLKINHLHAL
jgi:hypothetical protein